MKYAENTSVSVEKTRAELESTLRRFGADAFGYMTDNQKAMITFRAQGRFVRFMLPLPDPSEKRFTEYRRKGAYVTTQRSEVQARAEWEQACRSAWRALFLSVKAKLVTVESRISTFEDEFLSHLVLPDGRTTGEMMIPQIAEAYESGRMPTFQLQLPSGA